MRTTIRRFGLAVAVLGLVAGTTRQARAEPVITFGGTPSTYNDNSAWTLGFEFSTGQAFTVTDLGIYVGSGTLVGTHQVGIWDSGGTLLASTSVTSSGTVVAGFDYASIAPLQLAANQDYFVGATSDNGNGTTQTYAADSAIMTPAGITYLRDGFSLGSSLQDPTSSVGFNASSAAYFGANLMVTPTDQFTSTTPEPSTLAGAATAVLMSLGYAWRRHRAKRAA